MRLLPKKPVHVSALAAVLLGAALTGSSPHAALAQETKCYLMVCTGTVCVARQIECPKTEEPEQTPVPAPGSQT